MNDTVVISEWLELINFKTRLSMKSLIGLSINRIIGTGNLTGVKPDFTKEFLYDLPLSYQYSF
jgi:hypothetical protein